ncbi:MAG TPA: transaldolase [Thermoleophilaceae bacterium]|jgi:transaldolase
MNPIQAMTERGVAIWLDTLSRELIEDGRLAELMANLAVGGVTSNPTIFARAIGGSDRYDTQLRRELDAGLSDPRELFLALALEDVRRAAALMRPLHRATRGEHGFVSLEVTPDVAYDADATIAQALDLWHRLAAPNAMIKVPATAAGMEAVEELTLLGVNVNVTLLFAVERYEQTIEAYLRGLERRARRGEPLGGVRSVASFFVSRVDAKADARLPADSPLRGEVGIANARVAYDRFRERFAGARWDRLAERGATAQRPLWASTAPKDPAYRDVAYLEQLALPSTILTVPEPTLVAFADHGDPSRTRPIDDRAAERVLDAAPLLAEVTAELERDGVEAFRESYRELLDSIRERAGLVGADPPPRARRRPRGRPAARRAAPAPRALSPSPRSLRRAPGPPLGRTDRTGSSRPAAPRRPDARSA